MGEQRINEFDLIALHAMMHGRSDELQQFEPVEPIPGTSGGQQFLREVQAVVAKRLGDPAFDVQALADALSMSKRTLERHVKEVTGVSPATYIRQLRLLWASHLVRQGQVKTVAELASRVGFKDAEYFSRLFRKMIGTSPADGLQSE